MIVTFDEEGCVPLVNGKQIEVILSGCGSLNGGSHRNIKEVASMLRRNVRDEVQKG